MAGKRTFAQRTLAAWTFNSGCWTGVGTGEIEPPILPVVHYHVLEGPSKRLHVLEGPSKKLIVLKGSN